MGEKEDVIAYLKSLIMRIENMSSEEYDELLAKAKETEDVVTILDFDPDSVIVKAEKYQRNDHP